MVDKIVKKNDPNEIKLLKNFMKNFEEINNQNRLNPRILKTVAEDIEKAVKKFPEPSFITSKMKVLLTNVIDKIYGMRFEIVEKCNKN